ncbi:MAG: helix-turn-helix transcriptional regulator [Flavobacteriales bacterium]|nr:helix-turn-helix transcriptional regulator [Flavobacteriales bacterium]
MNLTDRFKYLMKLNNLSASAFAEKIGVQPSSISHILSERNKPSLEFIQKILIQFPNVSADWLITGNTKTNDSSIQTAPIEKKETSTPTPSDLKKKIKRIVLFYTDNTFEEFKQD